MKRREFMVGFSAATLALPLALPLAARAQQPTMPVVGLLYGGTPEGGVVRTTAFRRGLSESGFVEGQNVIIEYRWGQNDFDRMPDLVADLIRRRVAVLAALGTGAAVRAAARSSTTIPIVFGNASDPVGDGLVASFNRPGGNVTGISLMTSELSAKRMGLIGELLPHATRFGLLFQPIVAQPRTAPDDARIAATSLGRQIEVLLASNSLEIDDVFARLRQKQIEALLVNPSVLFGSRLSHLANAAMRYAVPVIYPHRLYVEAGGLMSYGPNLLDQYRQVGLYVGRILKGEKPSDLPVIRPTKFEFVINRQTARLLNIDIPATLLTIADEVIE